MLKPCISPDNFRVQGDKLMPECMGQAVAEDRRNTPRYAIGKFECKPKMG